MPSFTPEGFAVALRQFGARLDVPILVGLETGLASARAMAINRFISQGVGRAVFGKKPKGAFGLVKVIPAKKIGERYVGTLMARGMAAIQDQGGRTSPHLIPKRKMNKVLALKTGGFVNVKNAPLQHPGAQHPPMPFLQRSIDAAAPRIQTLIDREIQKFAAQLKVA